METYELAGYQRLQGAYKNLHNHALMMMLVTAIGVFWIFATRSAVLRVGAALLAGLAAVALYFTYVRTALLGLTAFVLAFLFFARHFRLALVILFVGVGIIFYDESLRARFADVFLFFAGDDAFVHKDKLGSGRWGLWKYSFQAYTDSPLGDMVLGLGLGKQWLMTQQYFDEYASARFGYVDPHNDYLTLLYQLGPIAVLCYLGQQLLVILYAIKIMARRFDRFSYYFAAFCAGLCVTATLTNFLSNAFVSRTTLGWYFWGFAGLLYAEWRSIRDYDRRAALGSPIPFQSPSDPTSVLERAAAARSLPTEN
jgi:O-antigen ligase